MDLTAAIKLLSNGQILTDDMAEPVFSLINSTLRDTLAEIDWDDAWDTIDLLGSIHRNAIPYLCNFIQDPGRNTSHDSYARVWAVRALAKIGGDISQAVPCLLQAQANENRALRREATITLRKGGYRHLVKRRWFGTGN